MKRVIGGLRWRSRKERERDRGNKGDTSSNAPELEQREKFSVGTRDNGDEGQEKLMK